MGSSPGSSSFTSSSTLPVIKTRKAYTITKQRENWTEEEHLKFLEALKLFDRDWKKIESFIGTKTVIQIRSHAQKYFLKVQKNNTGERIPPPRPKRKSVQPYPQKTRNSQDQDSGKEDMHYSNSPSEFQPANSSNWLTSYANPTDASFPRLPQTKSGHRSSIHEPNLSKIYAFLGSLFDTSPMNHHESLNEMSTVDKEVLQKFMHNLAHNLSNQHMREMNLRNAHNSN
eukprot:TRINITY_DN1926_c0_g1_i1.p1 TRINITY_DN1926_c0_g1~~TRINITY_DN1926_c0_g1_i1.p1  ORF type:complete len:228 (+),score=39.32 TRINITY_DN1926_c0_g1_i1:161-844(+)